MKKRICAILSVLLVISMCVVQAFAQEAGVPAPVGGNPPAVAAISADGLKELLISCTGYAGTAGSSLKGAVRAQELLDYCLNNQLAQTNEEAFLQLLSTAYAQLTDEQQEELTQNIESIFGVLDAVFGDYLSAEGLLDSAGVQEDMKKLLMQENAFDHYGVFKLAMLDVLGEFDALFLSCTGYAGTAGSSMKNAIAAKGVLEFCVRVHTADIAPAGLGKMLEKAYKELGEERAQELSWNMESIIELSEKAFCDYEAAEGLLESAGIAQDMKLLIEKKGAYADWAVFCLQMQRITDAE